MSASAASAEPTAESSSEPSERLLRVLTADHMQGIERFEANLWKIADGLRANSNLASNEYFMPIMGLIFLRHATNRFYEAAAAIEADRRAGRMPDRPLVEADFTRRRALNLPECARFDTILKTPKGENIGAALDAAMAAIETSFPPLSGQLPKDYARFESPVLEEMMRAFDSEALRTARGDVFGRIYEYFLAEFSKQGAHDNGEFFTPPSLVQTVVNVIEPDHGVILDPACGSGGMFVQSSTFIETTGAETMERVTFYGHEKNETTARLAEINLAVHGLQGSIRAGNEAITYYRDPHELVAKCDFVMANPPFNVDEVDAEKITGDRRLPFGLPGVNKAKRVSNANYLWISYFYSYLNETGRAGFVMSSQASSAGRAEALVRRKLIETGAVDVIIDIRGNFFYTRTVPCQLWFLDRAKERDAVRRDRVLMLDARAIFRKVSRSVCDFSPEQQKNLAAIVWLYRGQSERFLALVESYLDEGVAAGDAVIPPLASFMNALTELLASIAPFATLHRESDLLAEPWAELKAAEGSVRAEIDALGNDATHAKKAWPAAGRDNAGLNEARLALHPLADCCRDGTKAIDLAVKLASRVIDIAIKELDARHSSTWGNGEVTRAQKALETARAGAIEALARVRYFTKQADWLAERFPDAKLRDVEGLVKLIDRAEIAANDWSITPGRYVGVAPEEVDEDFDFKEALRAIHAELKSLNGQAADLAARIEKDLTELEA